MRKQVMRTCLAFCMVLAMVVAFMPKVTVRADDVYTLTLSVDNEAAVPGDTVTVTATVTVNGETVTDLSSTDLAIWFWVDTWIEGNEGGLNDTDNGGDVEYVSRDSASGKSLTCTVTLPSEGTCYIVAGMDETVNWSRVAQETAAIVVSADNASSGESDGSDTSDDSSDEADGSDASDGSSDEADGSDASDGSSDTSDGSSDAANGSSDTSDGSDASDNSDASDSSESDDSNAATVENTEITLYFDNAMGWDNVYAFYTVDNWATTEWSEALSANSDGLYEFKVEIGSASDFYCIFASSNDWSTYGVGEQTCNIVVDGSATAYYVAYENAIFNDDTATYTASTTVPGSANGTDSDDANSASGFDASDSEDAGTTVKSDNSTTQTGDAEPIAAVAGILLGCGIIAFAMKKKMA